MDCARAVGVLNCTPCTTPLCPGCAIIVGWNWSPYCAAEAALPCPCSILGCPCPNMAARSAGCWPNCPPPPGKVICVPYVVPAAAYRGGWSTAGTREAGPERWIAPSPPAPSAACVREGACSCGGRSVDLPPVAAEAGLTCAEETMGGSGIWGLAFCGMEAEAASWSGCCDAVEARDGGSAMAGRL